MDLIHMHLHLHLPLLPHLVLLVLVLLLVPVAQQEVRVLHQSKILEVERFAYTLRASAMDLVEDFMKMVQTHGEWVRMM